MLAGQSAVPALAFLRSHAGRIAEMAKAAKRTKRTPAKKRTSKKKAASKKKSRKKPIRRRPANPEQDVEEPRRKAERLEVQIEVWECYEKTHSMKMTASLTGHAEQVVRAVIRMDEPRMAAALDEFLERVIEAWEFKEIQAHAIMEDLFELYRGMLAEINQAQVQGRLTRIKDADGYELSVPSALNLLVGSKMFDQMTKVAQLGRSISDSYRNRGRAPGEPKPGEDLNDFDNWPDQKIAEALEAAGAPIPKILRRKVERLLEARPVATQ